MSGRNTKPATGRRRADAGGRARQGVGSVEKAVRGDLKRLGDDELASSGLAELALALAREVDKPGNSATSKSMCARVLNDALARLVELAPDDLEVSPLDEIRARREQRLAEDRVGSGGEAASGR